MFQQVAQLGYKDLCSRHKERISGVDPEFT